MTMTSFIMIYLFQARFPGFDPQEIPENHRQVLNNSLSYVVQKMVPSDDSRAVKISKMLSKH